MADGPCFWVSHGLPEFWATKLVKSRVGNQPRTRPYILVACPVLTEQVTAYRLPLQSIYKCLIVMQFKHLSCHVLGPPYFQSLLAKEFCLVRRGMLGEFSVKFLAAIFPRNWRTKIGNIVRQNFAASFDHVHEHFCLNFSLRAFMHNMCMFRSQCSSSHTRIARYSHNFTVNDPLNPKCLKETQATYNLLLEIRSLRCLKTPQTLSF